MRHGTQGHVTEPRGLTRAPAWRGGDAYPIFIFIHIIYGYSTYKHSVYQNSLTHKTVAPYISDISLYFSPCGTMFTLILNYRLHGLMRCVGLKACGSSRVDAVNFGSTQSLSAHMP